MDKFLKRHKLLKLTQEEMENLNRHLISKFSNQKMEKIPTKKISRWDSFISEIYDAFREELTPVLHSSSKNRGGNTSQLIL